MQMGRRSSVHSAQRTTFLLTALLQQVAVDEQWGLRSSHSPCTGLEAKERDALRSWLRARRTGRASHTQHQSRDTAQRHWQTQESLIYFSSFQDEIAAIVLGAQTARHDTEGVIRILQGKYGILLSSKPEASKDFAQQFTAIGATYDLADPSQVTCTPRTLRTEKLKKYRTLLENLKVAGPLTSLKDMQRFAGLHTFMARFLHQGEFYCNSAYVCLRAVPNTRADLRPISKALLKDAETVLRLLQTGAVAPLTADPVYAHPGLQGFSADASGSADVNAEGWGIHVYGILSHGKWPSGIKQALTENTISISPLELLTVAIALSIAGRYPQIISSCRQVILRSDSESACTVVNSMRADSVIMLEALRIFKEVKDSTGLNARLQHRPSSENTISDNLSRGAISTAVHEADELYGATVVPPPEQVQTWCNRLLRAALQATRHSTDTESRTTRLEL